MLKKTIIYILLIYSGAGLSGCIKENMSNCPAVHTVTFDPQNGDQPTQVNVQNRQSVGRPAPDPVRDGHVFAGWFQDADGTLPWDFENDVVTMDITLYGKWLSDFHTVTFVPGNGQPPATREVPHNALIDRPEDPVWAGHNFLGWFLTTARTLPWDFDNNRVTSDITLYGQWSVIPVFTVTFDSQGGSEVPEQVVPEGELANDPGDPVRNGYNFDSWNTQPDGSGAVWDFGSDPVTEDVTLYARWNQTIFFVVVLVPNGGYPVPDPTYQTVAKGGLVSEPAPMERSGYIFTGWYREWDFTGVAWDFNSDTVTANTILYAGWSLPFFTVTFETNGGTPVPPPQSVVHGGTVTRPANPIRDEYMFVDWYPTPAMTGLPWIFSTNTVNSDMTLYARWTQPVRK